MKQKLKQNLDLKVLAVLFSIIIWIIVVNIDDPIKSVEFNDVPIKFINAEALQEKNLVFMVENDLDCVDVTVSGRRSVIEELSKENIDVVADLKTLNELNSVPLVFSVNKYGNEIDGIKAGVDRISLDVEELKRVQKAISVETVGVPAEGYILGDAGLNLNQVNIEGPKSVVEKIAEAKVQVEVDDAISDVSVSSPIILYDTNGSKIDTTRLKININTVSVTQEILYTKMVPIVCNPSGTPAEGYKQTGEVTINPAEITIAGRKSVVEGISQVMIPSSSINISGSKTNYVVSFNVENNLPNGVRMISNNGEKRAVVTVFIEKEYDEEFVVNTSKIEVKNLPDGATYEILNGYNSVSDGKVVVKVSGLKKYLENVGIGDIYAYVDMEEYMTKHNLTKMYSGTIDVPLKFQLPGGLSVDDEFNVRIKVTIP